METIQLKAQVGNICWPYSLAVIQAIQDYPEIGALRDMIGVLNARADVIQTVYAQDLKTNTESGEGFHASEAIKFLRKFSSQPEWQGATHWPVSVATTKDLTRVILDESFDKRVEDIAAVIAPANDRSGVGLYSMTALIDRLLELGLGANYDQVSAALFAIEVKDVGNIKPQVSAILSPYFKKQTAGVNAARGREPQELLANPSQILLAEGHVIACGQYGDAYYYFNSATGMLYLGTQDEIMQVLPPDYRTKAVTVYCINYNNEPVLSSELLVPTEQLKPAAGLTSTHVCLLAVGLLVLIAAYIAIDEGWLGWSLDEGHSVNEGAQKLCRLGEEEDAMNAISAGLMRAPAP